MSEQKNPLQVLYDADLTAEWGWNKNFIDRHSKEMGSRGRPRKFIRMNVENFAIVYFCDELMQKLAKKAEALRAEEAFRSLRDQGFVEIGTLPRIGNGKILGRGGRVRAA